MLPHTGVNSRCARTHYLAQTNNTLVILTRDSEASCHFCFRTVPINHCPYYRYICIRFKPLPPFLRRAYIKQIIFLPLISKITVQYVRISTTNIRKSGTRRKTPLLGGSKHIRFRTFLITRPRFILELCIFPANLDGRVEQRVRRKPPPATKVGPVINDRQSSTSSLRHG